MDVNKNICPICGNQNNCGYVNGLSHEGCWCEKVEVPKELRDKIPEHLKGKACICKACVMEFKNNL